MALIEGSFWSETAVGTDSGATATHAAVSSNTHVVTCISGHVDADSLLQILDGTTVVWESKIDVSVEGFSFHFSGLSVPATRSALIAGKIAASSADCQVTICGHTI